MSESRAPLTGLGASPDARKPFRSPVKPRTPAVDQQHAIDQPEHKVDAADELKVQDVTNNAANQQHDKQQEPAPLEQSHTPTDNPFPPLPQLQPPQQFQPPLQADIPPIPTPQQLGLTADEQETPADEDDDDDQQLPPQPPHWTDAVPDEVNQMLINDRYRHDLQEFRLLMQHYALRWSPCFVHDVTEWTQPKLTWHKHVQRKNCSHH